MKYIRWMTLLIILLSATVSYGQNDLSAVRFVKATGDEEFSSCFDIQVQLNSEASRNLGSQNYRIFYDASRMRFMRDEVSSYLKDYAYNDVKVIQAVHNSDASGFGNLEFGSSLGFINMNVNDFGNYENLLKLSKDEWTSTIQICFEIYDKKAPLNMIWARQGVTDGYATAFTAISVISDNLSKLTKIQNYGDLQEIDSELQLRMANSGFNND